MNVRQLARQRPVSTLVTVAFVVALTMTAAYWAGAVPGVPRTLPTFVNLVMVTVVLLVITALAWGTSFALE